MKPYTENKESGIEWLGEVPKQWNIKRLRFLSKINPSKAEVGKLPGDFKVAFVPMESIMEYGGIKQEEERLLSDVYNGYSYFREGDVIVAKITPCFENGKGTLCENFKNYIGFGTTELHVIRTNDLLDSKFFFYLSVSMPFRKIGEANMYGAAGQKRVPEEFIKNFRVPYPSMKEQKSIAHFLDRETSRIDKLIEKKQKQIELLQEKRSALISHVVTKGLDPNVKMKDSGIEWLGEVPEHWNVKKLKFIAEVKSSNVDKNSKQDELPVRLCNYTDVYYRDIISNEIDFMSATATENEIRRFIIKHGDVLITKDSENWNDIAIPAYVDEKFSDVLCGYHLAQITPKEDEINGKYLFYSFLSNGINDQFRIASNGITRYGLGKYWLDNGLFLLPSLNEQRSIVSFLDQQTSRIDYLINQIRRSIEKLIEYRVSLISAAVTGKIDVRDEVSETYTDEHVNKIAAESVEDYNN